MRKVESRKDLDLFLVPPKSERSAPDPVVAAPQQSDATQAAQASLAAAAENMSKLAVTLAEQAKAAPKKLEAIVHRDAAGKMARVEITVV